MRNIRMITMLGMIKWSALNIVRHTPEIISPEILLVWSFSRSQLSAKIAVNMAVSTKSNPLRSKDRNGPMRPPSVAPITQ